jgi:hypothetical protein
VSISLILLALFAAAAAAAIAWTVAAERRAADLRQQHVTAISLPFASGKLH